MRRFLLAIGIAIAGAVTAEAHFTMLLPAAHAVKKGEPVRITYQWGHPFEHQLFDALPAVQLRMIAPDGSSRILTNSLEKIGGRGEGKAAAAYRVQFTPAERGDYTFILQTPPIWMEEDREFLRDTARVVVHVQAQKGWDARDDDRFQIVPLTRPYGLRAGMVFQARVLSPAPLPVAQPGATVFIERYNPQPPKSLPPDELITFTSKTDPNGVVTCTLPTAGWWCIAAQRGAGKRVHNGKHYPVRERAILWVYVNEAAK